MNVGKRVVERRTTLGMNQRDLAMRADVTPATLRSLEQDRRWPQDVNRAKIEQALGWAPGSLEAIRDGGEPAELTDDEPSQSTIPGLDDLTVGDVRAMPTERRREVLQQLALPGFDAHLPSRDSWALARAAAGVGPTLAGATDSDALASLRQSMREIAGMHGAVADVVRRAANDRLLDVVARLDAPRRDLVVTYAFELLDEQEAEAEGESTFGHPERNEVSDLAARRDSNSEVRSIRNVVDDDDPTAGVDWRDYAAHPATEPLEEDNPTP